MDHCPNVPMAVPGAFGGSRLSCSYAWRVSVSPLESAELAAQLLADELPGRFAHVAAVASRAGEVCRALGLDEAVVVAAAWLHDIGYAPGLVATGFHPLDGARHAASVGYDEGVVSLVAFHTGATVEAELRGLLEPLMAEFVQPAPDRLAVITYCDLTAGPGGQRVSVDERLDEILDRYPPDDVVHQSIRLAAPDLRATVADVEGLLAAQSQ
jgi:putative nucleotidyltransferase with HDIG domain